MGHGFKKKVGWIQIFVDGVLGMHSDKLIKLEMDYKMLDGFRYVGGGLCLP